jgi:hypothetical protein
MAGSSECGKDTQVILVLGGGGCRFIEKLSDFSNFTKEPAESSYWSAVKRQSIRLQFVMT